DRAPEAAVEAVDLETGALAVGDVQLGLGPAAVDEEPVRIVEAAGALAPVEGEPVGAVAVVAVDEARAVAVGHPDAVFVDRVRRRTRPPAPSTTSTGAAGSPRSTSPPPAAATPVCAIACAAAGSSGAQ